MGKNRLAYRVLVWKPDEKRQLGRTKRTWENNIKMNLQEVKCWGMDWIDLTQDRDSWRPIVNTLMNLRVP
jgi:hypothetical protein